MPDAPKTKSRVGRIFGRIAVIFFTVVVLLCVLFYGLICILCKGPSKSIRDLFVISCMETSFAKLFPPLVLSDAEIEEILKSNTIADIGDVTDEELDFSDATAQDTPADQPEIEVIDISGSTYRGKLMIVKDPSRVIVSGPSSYGKDSKGKKLDVIIADAGGVAGINAGGFADDNGMGNGGIPLGTVIRDGKLMYGGKPTVLVGFDQKNVLIVGEMSGEEALRRGIRDAVSFSPALIINGVPAQVEGGGGGLNPRTAIGQRADGSVLLLVLDGRQPPSYGANFRDLIEIMQQYGAVNACNLDGGSSTMMYYNGELLNSCASLYGPRDLPTAFVVKGGKDS